MSPQKTTGPGGGLKAVLLRRVKTVTTAKAPQAPRASKAVKAPQPVKTAAASKAVKATKPSKGVTTSTSTRRSGGTSRAAKVVLPPIGPDIDLDTEEVYLPDGTRLTEAKAEDISEWAIEHHSGVRGRPSVSAAGQRTPALTVRVAPATREALEAIASAEGRRLSDVSRDALDEYARRHAVQDGQ